MDGKERKRRNKPNQNQGEREGPRMGREEVKKDEAIPNEARLREALRKNRFCRGIKRGNRYVCGDGADENAIDKAVELLTKAVYRMLKWQIWDPWWIDKHREDWLMTRTNVREVLRDKYNNKVIDGIIGSIDEFIKYMDKFKTYWLRNKVGDEIKRLIEDLMNGKAKVIIWNNEAGISIHGKNITLKVDRAINGITVQLMFKRLRGITVKVLDVFRMVMNKEEYTKFVNELLVALRCGFAETDEGIDEGRPIMGTTHVWQAIVWPLLYPGETHICIKAINVNESNITIQWHLRSNEYYSFKSLFFRYIEKFSKEALLLFMFTAILGDGSVFIHNNKAVVKIVMSSKKFNMWRPILDKLWDMGFKWRKWPPSNNPNNNKNKKVEIRFHSGYATDLVKSIISTLPSILRDLLNALNFEKWNNMKQIASMEPKRRVDKIQVNVTGYKFTVNISSGTLNLTHNVKDKAEIDKVCEALKARYGNEFRINIRRSNRYLIIAIPANVIEKYDEIKRKVVEALCRKLEETKNERKRQRIIKALRRLTPTEGAAAAIEVTPA